MTVPAVTPPSTATSTAAAMCPHCGAVAPGRFCAGCGTPVNGAACARCRAPLTPGARFCHRCGTPAGSAPVEAHGFAGALPWTVASIALVALVALVAGQRFSGGSAQPAGAAFAPGPGDDAGASPAAGSPVAAPFAALSGGARSARGPRAPDISALSPAERADRLFNRIMTYDEQGKHDSVEFFAPMALAAYEMMEPLNADQRYHMGRIGEVAGLPAVAGAQADTILRAAPNHLLGLILAAAAAGRAGDEGARRTYLGRLVAAYPAESRSGRPEYAQHQHDIDVALAAARRR